MLHMYLAALRADPGPIPQAPRRAQMREELEDLLTSHSARPAGPAQNSQLGS